MIKAKNDKAHHYVDNKEFYRAMCDYKEKCFEAEEKHEELIAELKEQGVDEDDLPECDYPRIPEYIGKCLLLIPSRLANSPGFYSYTYRDEMIADGYEDCVLRIRCFDHLKYKNPFAYFTQISYFAFLRRIKKEKKQKTVKSEMIKNSNALHYFESEQHQFDSKEHQNTYLEFLLDNIDVVESDAEKEQAKRKKIVKTTKAHQKKLKEQRELDALEAEREQFLEKENERKDADDLLILGSVPETIDDYYKDLHDEDIED